MFKVEIAKSGKILEINWDEMPDNAKNYIIAYGLKQKLNDASASITKDEVPDNDERLAQKVAMAENVLESLMAGDITTRQSAAGQTLEQREATKWLRAKYKELFKEKISEMEDSSNDFLANRIAIKLGVEREVFERKLEELSIKLAEKARKIAALKSDTISDLEF